MKINTAFLSIVLGTILVFAHTSESFAKLNVASSCYYDDDWQTVDTLDTTQGESEVVGMTSMQNKTVFAVGGDQGTVGNQQQWLVRRSTDYGDSWGTVDHGVVGYQYSTAYAAATSPNHHDTVYVVGGALNGSNFSSNHWIVKRSTDGGLSWTIVDDFVPNGASGALAQSVGVTRDAIYVAGLIIQTGTAQQIWVVRRSADGGSTWSVVETISSTVSNGASAANGVVVTPDGHIYVGGQITVAIAPNSRSAWLVRGSSDGLNWYTADEFFLDPTLGTAVALRGASHSDGTVVFAGAATFGGIQPTQEHWIVRKLSPETTEWKTVDDFQEQGSTGAAAYAATFSEGGKLFVTGSSITAFSRFLTRRQNEPNRSFYDSDSLPGPVGASYPNLGYAAITASSDDILTGGTSVEMNDSHPHWIIRKLKCQYEISRGIY